MIELFFDKSLCLQIYLAPLYENLIRDTLFPA